MTKENRRVEVSSRAPGHNFASRLNVSLVVTIGEHATRAKRNVLAGSSEMTAGRLSDVVSVIYDEIARAFHRLRPFNDL